MAARATKDEGARLVVWRLDICLLNPNPARVCRLDRDATLAVNEL
jgi:hypothetical protein